MPLRLLAILSLALSTTLTVSIDTVSAQVKNVILLVGDGAGYNTWEIGSMYRGRWDAKTRQSTEIYDREGWVRYGCSTHPLTTSKTPTGTGTQDPATTDICRPSVWRVR